jgi:hypothetical protein
MGAGLHVYSILKRKRYIAPDFSVNVHQVIPGNLEVYFLPITIERKPENAKIKTQSINL